MPSNWRCSAAPMACATGACSKSALARPHRTNIAYAKRSAVLAAAYAFGIARNHRVRRRQQADGIRAMIVFLRRERGRLNCVAGVHDARSPAMTTRAGQQFATITSATGSSNTDAPAQAAHDRQCELVLPAGERRHHDVCDRKQRDDRDSGGGQSSDPSPSQSNNSGINAISGTAASATNSGPRSHRNTGEMPAMKPNRMPPAIAGNSPRSRIERAGVDVLPVVVRCRELDRPVHDRSQRRQLVGVVLRRRTP